MRKKEEYSEEKEILREQIKKLAEDTCCENMASNSNAICKLYALLKVDGFFSITLFGCIVIYLVWKRMVAG